jgi:hypothetical protein
MHRYTGEKLEELLARGLVVVAPEGSVTLWRSDTPHANTNNDSGAYKICDYFDNEENTWKSDFLYKDEELVRATCMVALQSDYMYGY